MVTNYLASRLFSTTSLFFKGVRKQPPGHTLVVEWDADREDAYLRKQVSIP